MRPDRRSSSVGTLVYNIFIYVSYLYVVIFTALPDKTVGIDVAENIICLECNQIAIFDCE